MELNSHHHSFVSLTPKSEAGGTLRIAASLAPRLLNLDVRRRLSAEKNRPIIYLLSRNRRF